MTGINDILKERGEKGDAEFLKRAFEFAKKAHGGQKRNSGEPYIIHPLNVALTLAKLRLDDATVAAALLHDVVDDTNATQEQIKENFGEEIEFLVEGTSKLGKIQYRGVERHVENLRKMFIAMAQDIRVVLIKLADRLHNMKTLSALPKEKQQRIASETLLIYAPIAGRLGMGELKGELEDLAFPYIYPKDYDWLLENVAEAFKEREEYIKRITPEIKKWLSGENIKILEIQARAKHYYSLWNKLQRKDLNLSKIHDLIALRVIVPNITACYAAMGAIHKRWRPIPGRIKDYIAIPKPNGYKSLHTTVFCEEGRITEFQIRTPEMHAEADYGIAAYWLYSEHGKKNKNLTPEKRNSLRWIEQLRDWQKEARGTDEFLDTLRIDFFKDRIFVFTPKGDVIELPEGATPLDFAYHIHSEIGDKAAGARINDRFVGLDERLHNGDIVEIITQKNKKPSARWLSIAKTSAARHHIRKSLRLEGIDVAPPPPEPLCAELTLSVKDRVGVLKDVSRILSRAGFNVIKIEGWGHGDEAGIKTIITIKSRRDVKQLLEKMQKIKGVLRASGRII